MCKIQSYLKAFQWVNRRISRRKNLKKNSVLSPSLLFSYDTVVFLFVCLFVFMVMFMFFNLLYFYLWVIPAAWDFQNTVIFEVKFVRNRDVHRAGHLSSSVFESKIESVTYFAWISFPPKYSSQIKQTCCSPWISNIVAQSLRLSSVTMIVFHPLKSTGLHQNEWEESQVRKVPRLHCLVFISSTEAFLS